MAGSIHAYVDIGKYKQKNKHQTIVPQHHMLPKTQTSKISVTSYRI